MEDTDLLPHPVSVIKSTGMHCGLNRFSDVFLAVHPTVTLSIVDHYTRVAKDTSKRVVGVVLGEYMEGKTHATSSFAVPFEEDLRDPTLWYLDHNYLEGMAAMFSKVLTHVFHLPSKTAESLWQREGDVLGVVYDVFRSTSLRKLLDGTQRACASNQRI